MKTAAENPLAFHPPNIPLDQIPFQPGLSNYRRTLFVRLVRIKRPSKDADPNQSPSNLRFTQMLATLLVGSR